MPTVDSLQIQQQLNASGIAQVIVVLKSSAGAAALGRGRPIARLQKHFVTSEMSHESALRVAMFESAGAGLAVGRKVRRAPSTLVRMYPNLGIMLGTVRPEGLAALAREGDVASVTGAPNLALIKPRHSAPVAQTGRMGWGLSALGVPQLWRRGFDGNGVVIAHLDTGADGKHPALRKAFANFAEFDDVGDAVTPAPAPHDSGEHGTHTAATLVGRPVSGFSMGIAPGARLASAIVIEGGNVIARVLAGLDWALGNGARVLSMSLGLTGYWRDFIPVIQILRTRGLLPVIAVGNEGAGTSRSPGNYVEVLSVGASDRNGAVASFSSSQRFDRPKKPNVPDLVGPGVDITSAVPGGRYKMMSGTSMATPHIAGLAALLFQAKPSASVDEVEAAILGSCALGPGMLADRAGRGLPNGPKALELLTAARIGARRVGRGKVQAHPKREPHRSAKRSGRTTRRSKKGVLVRRRGTP